MRYALIALLLFSLTARADDWETGIGQLDQVTRGLVGYWSMRSSGATVHDETGGTNGTAINAPSLGYNDGCVGSGAGFLRESSQRIYFGTNGLTFMGYTNLTVSYWQRPLLSSASNVFIAISKYRAAGTGSYFFDRRTNGMVVCVLLSGNYAKSRIRLESQANVAPLNQWTHTLWTWSGATNSTSLNLYINGALASRGNEETTAFNGFVDNILREACFGSRESEEFSDGSLDEVRIYDRQITTDEIKQLYRMGKYILENR